MESRQQGRYCRRVSNPTQGSSRQDVIWPVEQLDQRRYGTALVCVAEGVDRGTTRIVVRRLEKSQKKRSDARGSCRRARVTAAAVRTERLRLASHCVHSISDDPSLPLG